MSRLLGVDVSELHALAADLDGIPPQIAREAKASARKAAVNIKNEWRQNVSRSRYFRMTHTINFTETTSGETCEAEVGPNRYFRHARLAGIGHFGGANGGGGTLPDPDVYVASEGPRFEQAISDLVAKVLA